MGGFDLGVAGFIVAGAVTVTALQGSYHIPFLVALAAAVVGSAVLGGDRRQRLPPLPNQPLIVTLAMGTIAVGDRAGPERRHRRPAARRRGSQRSPSR